jgi:hypothetical protein
MSESDPYFDVIEPRKPGRPRKAEPGSAIMTWVPASEHDRIVKLASQRGESVSTTVRLLLKSRQFP